MKTALFLTFLIVCGVFASVPKAQADAGPMAELQQTIEKIQTTLSGTMMSEDAKKKVIQKMIFDRLDMTEICKRVLGRHYELNKARFQEFVELFGGLIEKKQLGKVGEIGGVKVIFEKERIDSDSPDFGTVDVKIVTANGTEVPVAFRVHRTFGQWKVYDISVEGISLVANYRSQVNKIISTESFDELIHRLRTKNGLEK